MHAGGAQLSGGVVERMGATLVRLRQRQGLLKILWGLHLDVDATQQSAYSWTCWAVAIWSTWHSNARKRF